MVVYILLFLAALVPNIASKLVEFSGRKGYYFVSSFKTWYERRCFLHWSSFAMAERLFISCWGLYFLQFWIWKRISASSDTFKYKVRVLSFPKLQRNRGTKSLFSNSYCWKVSGWSRWGYESGQSNCRRDKQCSHCCFLIQNTWKSENKYQQQPSVILH